MAKKTESAAVLQSVEVLTVQVPVRKAMHGYKTNRIDVTLSMSESDRLHDIFSGLQRDGATLKSGKPIGSPNQAIIWLIQNLKPVEIETQD